MKIIKTIVVLAVLSGTALFGAKLYTQNQSDELSGTIDQLNPLVSKGEVYLKTKKPIVSIATVLRHISNKLSIKMGNKKNLHLQQIMN